MNTKFVYVVRWANRIDGEEECGNFEVCYTDEKSAEKVMLKDFENIKADWQKDSVNLNSRQITDDDGVIDYCSIWDEDNNTYDYYDWYIDKLEVNYK